jgi:hypothetical protein
MRPTIEIDVLEHYDEIVRVVERYALPMEAIEIVPSIQGWCHERGLAEDDPFRIARIFRNVETGRYVILFAERMSHAMVGAVISALEERGFESEVNRLSDSQAVVRHITLHEIAHGLDKSRS